MPLSEAPLTLEEIRSLPKIELHCHLDGSVPLSSFLRLSGQHPGAWPAGESAMRKTLQAPPRCNNLAEYLACFGPSLLALRNADFLRRATLELMEELAFENVIYAELRFAPQMLSDSMQGAEDLLLTVLDALRSSRRKDDVTATVILCMMRHLDFEANLQTLALAEKYKNCGVVAVDLAGDERAWPPALYDKLFDEAAKRGLPYTIHAGECGSADNVWQAVKRGAVRIGHGIAAAFDEALMNLLAEQGTLLEMCPVSNLQTGAVESWENYPLELFLRKGIRVCINTDNRTVSGTSLTNEFSQLSQHYNSIDRDCLRQLTLNALEGSFICPAEKDNLLKKIRNGFTRKI